MVMAAAERRALSLDCMLPGSTHTARILSTMRTPSVSHWPHHTPPTTTPSTGVPSSADSPAPYLSSSASPRTSSTPAWTHRASCAGPPASGGVFLRRARACRRGRGRRGSRGRRCWSRLLAVLVQTWRGVEGGREGWRGAQEARLPGATVSL